MKMGRTEHENGTDKEDGNGRQIYVYGCGIAQGAYI